MPGWVTQVTYSGALHPDFDPDLPDALIGNNRVLYHPYVLIQGVPNLLTWDDMRAEIANIGKAVVWCRLKVPANSNLDIPGATFYPGDIPEIPVQVDPPVAVPSQYKTDLQATATAFKALLERPEWELFRRRFAQLDPEDLEAEPAYKLALEITERLEELTRGT